MERAESSRSARAWSFSRGSHGGLLLVAQLLLALLLPSTEGRATAAEAVGGARRPNILFIFSDDHALQSIGAYGSRINQTPHIDRIAQQGIVFDRSFCANSICGPSRACIQTGKHSHLNGFYRNGNVFDGSQTTFPKLLQGVGYQTALIGKWHLESAPTGFDYWEVLPDQGSYYNPDFIQMDGSLKRYEGYCTDLTTEMALKWLREQRDGSKPFLLMCQHKAPHRNWAPAERHFSLYRDAPVPEPATLLDDYSGRTDLLKQNEMTIRQHMHWGHDMKFHGTNPFPQHFAGNIPNGEYDRMTPAQKAAWDAQYEPENQALIRKLKAGEMSDEEVLRWKYQRYIKDYLRCVAAVDESVGQLLEYLDKSGLADNTIVVYSSDQGFYLGEHGWYDKRWMYEESLKMPLLVRWPGVIQGGARSSALVQNIDYAPTFLEAAGVEVPGEMQGRSLLPLLEDEGKTPADWRDAIYYAYYENAAVHNVPVHDGVRTDRYKLIYFPASQQWQLMDLELDPQELRSFHEEPAYRPILEALQQRYRDLRQLYGVNTAAIPQSKGDEGWWRDRHQANMKRVAESNVDLVFLGDSITQGWEGEGRAVWEERYAKRNAVNLGFSGDRTENALFRVERIDFSKIDPKQAVVMIGTNNTGHLMQDPAEVAEGVEKIVRTLREREPSMRILLLGVFPRGKDRLDKMRLNNVAINDLLRRLPRDPQVQFVDIGHVFLQADGTLPDSVMPDALHLNAEGYRRWAEAIEPYLVP